MSTPTTRLLVSISEAGRIAACGRTMAFEMVKVGEWETIVTPYGRRVVLASVEEWVERLRREGKT